MNSLYWMANRIFPDRDCNRWKPYHRGKVFQSSHHHCKQGKGKKCLKIYKNFHTWICSVAKTMWKHLHNAYGCAIHSTEHENNINALITHVNTQEKKPTVSLNCKKLVLLALLLALEQVIQCHLLQQVDLLKCWNSISTSIQKRPAYVEWGSFKKQFPYLQA